MLGITSFRRYAYQVLWGLYGTWGFACVAINADEHITAHAISHVPNEAAYAELQKVVKELAQTSDNYNRLDKDCIHGVSYPVTSRDWAMVARDAHFPIPKMRPFALKNKIVADFGTGPGRVPLDLQYYYEIAAYGFDVPSSYNAVAHTDYPEQTLAKLLRPYENSAKLPPLLDPWNRPVFYQADVSIPEQVQKVCAQHFGKSPCFDIVLAIESIFRHVPHRVIVKYYTHNRGKRDSEKISLAQFLDLPETQNDKDVKVLAGTFASAYQVLNPNGEMWLTFYASPDSGEEELIALLAHTSGFVLAPGGSGNAAQIYSELRPYVYVPLSPTSWVGAAALEYTDNGYVEKNLSVLRDWASDEYEQKNFDDFIKQVISTQMPLFAIPHEYFQMTLLNSAYTDHRHLILTKKQ